VMLEINHWCHDGMWHIILMWC